MNKSTDSAKPARAVGYIRVSTARQASEGISLAMQRSRIEEWCRVHGYELVAIHEDAGISGKRVTTRPGLRAALEQACEERAALVFYSMSRLSRSLRDMLAISDRLREAGADLVSLTESIDTTAPAGELTFHLLAALSQFERKLIVGRIKDALALKRERGEHLGRAPRGMKVAEDGKLVPDGSDGLKIAERARELRRDGLSLRGIAKQLTTEGYRPERGRRFCSSTVRYCLNNPRLVAA